MTDNTVALAALGVMGTCVGLVAWVVKKVLGDVAPALHKHAETAVVLGTAIEKNTIAQDKNSAAQQEVLTFMKKLNGRLPGIVQEKMREKERNDAK